MPSPFPGMDPYLEHPAWWPDFHARFIPIICDALNEVLPDQYDARIETATQLVDIPEGEIRLMEPDIFIAGHRPAKATKTKPKATATLVPNPSVGGVKAAAVHSEKTGWEPSGTQSVSNPAALIR